MANYRVVKIDKSGQLSRHRSFVCDNDDDAIVWAKQSVEELRTSRSNFGAVLASSPASNRSRSNTKWEVTAAMGKGPLNRGPNWTADEDRKLLDLIEAGKSWISIAVLLKRSQASVKVRARTLKRRAQKKTAPALASLCRRDG